MNHVTRISEGHESARRILKHTPLTSDPLLLHRVDTSQLGDRDGVSVGGCCNHDCREGRDCPNDADFYADIERLKNAGRAAACIAGVILVLVVGAFVYSCTAMNTPVWPFPPRTGPVPWTKKQIEEYARKQREELPEAPI